MSKKIMTIVIMLIMLTALPIQVFAMTEVSVELPVVVEGIKGTVVIEAVDDAPLPEITEFRDVTEGMFEISYTQPETYHYRIYQQIPAKTGDVIYDITVYNVAVSVLSDDDGMLHPVCTISIDGDNEKRESIAFKNKIPDKDKGGKPPYTGDTSNSGIWLIVSLSSLAIILIMLFVRRRKESTTE